MTSGLVRFAAVCSSLLAAVGGLWILYHVKWEGKNDALSIGIGFYFLAKAFFLGPMLIVVAAKRVKAGDGTESPR